MSDPIPVPSVSVTVTYAQDGSSTRSNALGMRPMQERTYQKRGEQYLLIKSPPASGKSRALMFIALDKLANQGLKQAIIIVPERSIGASFHDEPLGNDGFFTDWKVEPRWNLCDAAGSDNGSKVEAVQTSTLGAPTGASALPECWSAPMPPSASRWTGSDQRSSTTGSSRWTNFTTSRRIRTTASANTSARSWRGTRPTSWQ